MANSIVKIYATSYAFQQKCRKFVQLIIELMNKIIENTRNNCTALFGKNLRELYNINQ